MAVAVSKYAKGEKSATRSNSSTAAESKLIKKLAPTSIPDSILAMLRAGRSIPKSKARVMKNNIIPNMETNGRSKSKAGILKFSDQVMVSSSEAQEISSKIMITRMLARKRPHAGQLRSAQLKSRPMCLHSAWGRSDGRGAQFVPATPQAFRFVVRSSHPGAIRILPTHKPKLGL